MPAGNKHPLWWKPRRSPLHKTYELEGFNPQTTVSRSVAADGSLLSAMELVPCLVQSPCNGNNPKNFLKRYMYHPLGKNFPRGYTFTYLSALAGYQATVL